MYTKNCMVIRDPLSSVNVLDMVFPYLVRNDIGTGMDSPERCSEVLCSRGKNTGANSACPAHG